MMYSQLARPYAPGFFFSMMLVWYWSKFLFGDKRRSDLIWFVIAGLGCVYSHYFSLLLAGLIGGVGIFFLRREIWKPYLIAGAAIIILFLPYLPIFLFQLNAGGVGGPGGWLGKPTPEFFGNHIWFIFDESRPIVIGAIAFSIITVIISRTRLQKFHLLALFLWAAPLLIGYFYSQKSPVLQNSVLLFSFPFLLMLLFAWVPPLEKWKRSPFISGAFAVVLLIYVTVYKPFHLTNHFGRLKEISASSLEWGKKFGEKNISCAYNVDYPYYMEYYWQKFQEMPSQVLMYQNTGFYELKKFRELVANTTGDFFVYGWSTKYSPPEIIPIIKEKFPFMIEKKEWFNSAVYLFSKKEIAPRADENKDIIFETTNDFSPRSIYSVTVSDSKKSADTTVKWTDQCKVQVRDSSMITYRDSMQNAGVVYNWGFLNPIDYDARLDSNCIYSSGLTMTAGDILKNPDNTILFSTNVKLLNEKTTVVMVIIFERDGQELHWNGIESATQIDSTKTNEWQPVYFGLQLPADLKASDTVKFFCYTKDGSPVLIDYLNIKTLTGHSGIYGPRPDFK